jgi:phospholipase C
MLIASPWSRGGKVCSEIFDHTSSLRFLEVFLSKKFNKPIVETNISTWRRAICGDLTSAFSTFQEKDKDKVDYLSRDPFIQTIHSAQFRETPANFKKLAQEEIAQINRNPSASPLLPHQEPGVRTACALPYQLYAEGSLDADKKTFKLTMEARDEVFGQRSVGSPFRIYAPVKYRSESAFEVARSWDYAVKAGDSVADAWTLSDFEDGRYHLRVYGPNGFFREFGGSADDPLVSVTCEYEGANKKSCTGNVLLKVNNRHSKTVSVDVRDNSYGRKSVSKKIKSGEEGVILLNLESSHHWYDFNVAVSGSDGFVRRYAGKVETGKDGVSDPVMGREV